MVNVHDYAHNLARALKECPDYKLYAAARKKLESNAAGKKMVEDLHQRQMEVQASLLQGKEPSQQQQDAMQKLAATASSLPDVREYLMAEQRLGTLLNDVYKIISDAVDFEGAGGKGK